jgi:hypothetical protein
MTYRVLSCVLSYAKRKVILFFNCSKYVLSFWLQETTFLKVNKLTHFIATVSAHYAICLNKLKYTIGHIDDLF